MRHRHIKDGYEDTVAAVEDVLARGTVADWRELAERIRREPTGPAARFLQTVLEHVPMYGTTVIWRDFLQRLQSSTPLIPP